MATFSRSSSSRHSRKKQKRCSSSSSYFFLPVVAGASTALALHIGGFTEMPIEKIYREFRIESGKIIVFFYGAIFSRYCTNWLQITVILPYFAGTCRFYKTSVLDCEKKRRIGISPTQPSFTFMSYSKGLKPSVDFY